MSDSRAEHTKMLSASFTKAAERAWFVDTTVRDVIRPREEDIAARVMTCAVDVRCRRSA